MADRPILFSGSMVRAMLEDRKTQTRRIIKPRGKHPSLFDGTWADSYVLDPGNESWRQADIPFKNGDRLWVREAWRTLHANDCLAPRQLADDPSKITYEADPENRNPLWAFGRLRASMHMPRWASRLTLIVTDVRVERLQDISEYDAKAEGVLPYFCAASKLDTYGPKHAMCGCDHKAGFCNIWETINGIESWNDNPWVVAYTFRVIKANIDRIGETQ